MFADEKHVPPCWRLAAPSAVEDGLKDPNDLDDPDSMNPRTGTRLIVLITVLLVEIAVT
jgi:hypothetical protein